MGCATTREKIEANMMKLKLERVDVRNEREDKINELQELTGEKIVRKPIPDYYIHEDETNPSHKRKKSNNKKKNLKNKYSHSRKRIKEESENEESENEESEDEYIEDSEEMVNDDDSDENEERQISTKRRK